MRFFYVAVAETRRDMLGAIIETIREWNERLKGRVEVGILVRYTKWRSRSCIPCIMAKENNIKVFIDNGAFSFLTAEDLETWPRLERLEFWLKDYSGWLQEREGEYDFAALTDLPVHGKHFLEKRERLQRVILSTLLQARLLSLLPDRVRPRMVPVLQGFTAGEYLWNYDLMEKLELLEETAYGGSGEYSRVLAVGSICVRKPSANGKTGILADGAAAGTLDRVMHLLLNHFPPGVQGFHFFGLHREAVANWGRHPRFFAADSGAHGLNYRYKWRTVLGCTAPNTPSCAAKAVDHQLKRTLAPLLSESLEAYGVIG